jgi:hypothetical protein
MQSGIQAIINVIFNHQSKSMKPLKNILIIFITALSMVACNDEIPEPEYPLTAENLAGTYNIKSLDANLNATAVIQGILTPVSTGSITGDTFNVSFVINANGTYTATGGYRMTTTINPIGASPATTSEIVAFDDAGTYTLDTDSNTITLNSNGSDFLEGSIQIRSFNETSFTISQETSETEGGITIDADFTIVFERI